MKWIGQMKAGAKNLLTSLIGKCVRFHLSAKIDFVDGEHPAEETMYVFGRKFYSKPATFKIVNGVLEYPDYISTIEIEFSGGYQRGKGTHS